MRWLPALFTILTAVTPALAQKEYGFDNRKPSGQPYLTPEESVKRMKAPPGFSVKLFAAEPLMTNPIAMTIDDKGRVWIIESFEYPKRTPKGMAPRDRIVILEDTDGDGIADKRTVFAEGKDFPVSQERAEKGLGAFDMASGLEVSSDGCYVGAPPYLWHIKGKDKAESFEIVASGFGSQDTHETLNTFTWGPDGWLYGLHGVFTTSKVKPTEPGASATGGEPIDLDAGVWRYHPRTRKFEVFAEGTSNPWGMDFNSQGECFICACVIPHLFHMVPGGIYIKQGGKPSNNQYAYGAIKEICDHTFHKESGWAHAGLLCLDAPHMPKEYQNSVIFGSIHGCSIKRNTLKPNGSTFIASRADDFLVSSDKNFRPIQLRWAPDGSILVSDWHDQNPCHQTNPDDWDYEHGRIYRIVPPKPDKPVKSEEMPFQLRTQTRLLMEQPKKKAKKEHFFSIASFAIGEPKVVQLSETDFRKNLLEFHSAIFNNCPEVVIAATNSEYESIRLWAIRTLSDGQALGMAQRNRLKALVQKETSLRVLQEVAASLSRRPAGLSYLPVLEQFYKKPNLAHDPTIPFFLWLATEKELRDNREGVLKTIVQHASKNELLIKHLLPRVARRIATSGQTKDLLTVMRFTEALPDDESQIAALSGLAEAVKGRMVPAPLEWATFSIKMGKKDNPEVNRLVQAVAASLNDPAAINRALNVVVDQNQSVNERVDGLRQLALAKAPEAVSICMLLVSRSNEKMEVRVEAARSMSSFTDANIAKDVLVQWKQLPLPVRAELVNTLRSRKPWAKALIEALGNKTVPRSDLNDNVALAIRQFKDKELNALLDKHYGVFRDSPAEINALLTKLRKEVPAARGNAVNGKAVFTKHCLQCHKFDGQGHDVGPNLDGAERSMEYLLVNIVDPNRVVGTPYFSRTIVLKNGKIITGILAEEDATTLRLKRENAVIEVIVKADIDEQTTSTKSLMPEGLPNNMTIQELRDLIRYLEPPAKK